MQRAGSDLTRCALTLGAFPGPPAHTRAGEADLCPGCTLPSGLTPSGGDHGCVPRQSEAEPCPSPPDFHTPRNPSDDHELALYVNSNLSGRRLWPAARRLGHLHPATSPRAASCFAGSGSRAGRARGSLCPAGSESETWCPAAPRPRVVLPAFGSPGILRTRRRAFEDEPSAVGTRGHVWVGRPRA